MNRINGKRMILWIMTLVFCVTACVPAFASVGDRIVVRNSRPDEDVNMSVNTVFRIGDGFCIYGRKDTGYYFSMYADAKAEPETFVMEDRKSEETQDEFGSYTYTSEYFNTLFSWKDELYAIVFRQVSGDDFYRTEKIWFQKVKMENGVATLEECDLPEPDFSALKDGDDENGYYNNLDSAFTVGDSLVGMAYTENGRNIYAFDLETGFCTEYELGDMGEMIPGPEGSVLISKVEWSEKGSVTTMIRLNLADGSEETVWQKDEELYNTNPVYDPETNTLYYTYRGELWAAPDMDIERAEAVNDLDTAYGAIMLPGGFVLVWDYNVVQIKNTDPTQRGSIRLRISDNGYGGTLGETIYDMNNTRGDVSVIRQRDWNNKADVVQAMMNRDAGTDIYALTYDSNEFSALRKRGYLADLSGNAQIAEAVERMYPYVQNGLKQDGKIIGIPITISGQTLGLNMKIWTRLGKTEEDLPKTWDQFFDWLETLPDLLPEDVPLVGYWEDRSYVRATILSQMLTEYQVWMDGREENYLFNTPVLNGLVTRLNNLDYDALRIREVQEDEDMEGYDGEYHEPLIELYFDSTISGYGGNLIPMKFAFEEGGDPILPVEVTVAFVNPYSEHPQEAQEFLALALKNLDQYMQYTVFTDKTEPVASPYFEQNKKSWQEYLDTLNKRLETAEGENRTEIEESIREIEDIMADEESYAWNISPTQIEQYLKNVSAFKIMDYSFINDMSASGDENEDEPDPYYDMLYGEDSMKLSADEVLNRIDKRIQMIRLEGN